MLKGSFNRHPETNYSFDWSVSVVRRLVDSDARATYFFYEFLGLNEKWLATVLGKKPDEWAFLKSAYGYYKRWTIKQSLMSKKEIIRDVDMAENSVKYSSKGKNLEKVAPRLMEYLDRQIELINTDGAD